MNYVIRHSEGSRPSTIVTPRELSDFAWPDGETVETFTAVAAFDTRVAELTAPFDKADKQADADAAAAAQAWQDALASATTVAQIRDVLLGNGLPARAESRPT